MPQSPVETDLDTLVGERFVAFRRKLIHTFSENHPHIFAIVKSVLSDRQSKIGMQVLEKGQIAGNYTINLQGIDISEVQSGALVSDIHHPLLGTIKPYLVIERMTLEQLIADEEAFTKDIFTAFTKYLPEITLKFLR